MIKVVFFFTFVNQKLYLKARIYDISVVFKCLIRIVNCICRKKNF